MEDNNNSLILSLKDNMIKPTRISKHGGIDKKNNKKDSSK